MPLVVVHRENKFNEVLRSLRNTGGERFNAYKKICEIRQSLELGERNVCQTTDHGESRLKNCVKYDLGNGYRLVTVDFKEVVILCYAGKHDDVDHWLDHNQGQTFTYDKATKKIGLIVEREVIRTVVLPAATNPPEDTRPYLLQIDGLDWEALVPAKSIRRRLLNLGLNSDEGEILEVLGDVGDEINREIADLALNLVTALRDGKRDIAERHRDLYLGRRERATEETPITPDVVLAEANSDTLIVLNDLSEEEFDALWDPSRFQEWMLYLHPGQKRVVDEDLDKPCVFTGVSGSGKTCVLVHRALRLAKLYPGEPILILTLNRSLAHLIEKHVDRLANGSKHQVKVMAFYDYLESVLKLYGLDDFLTSISALLELKSEITEFVRAHQPTELTSIFAARDDYEIETLWKQFCEDPNSQATKDALSRLTIYLYDQDKTINAERYLKDELTLVRSAFRLAEEYEGYRSYDRGGRCIQFQDKRREDILRLLRTWERFQVRHGKLDGMGLTQAAIVALDYHDGALPQHLRFRSVLVDEFQDFSTLDLELISRIPSIETNGLFLTGDTAQKIYTKDFDLPRAGMAPAQRINRSILKNYRNSRQILEAAHLLIEAYANESTAKHEGVTVLKPEYAQRDGARPFVCATNDQLQAVWALAGEWLASGYPAFSVCIATANPDVVSVRQISDAAPVGIKTSRLTGDYLQRTDIVVVSDIYNIKGFEFSLIVIVGLGDGEFPPKGVPVGETWREALRLYVAMTRGRDEVCLVHQGTPSPFIRAMSGTLTPRPLTFAKIIPVPLPAAPEFIPDDPKEKPQPKPSIDVAAPIPLIVPTSATVPEPEPVQPTAPPAFIPISGEPEVAPSKNEPEEMVLNGVTLLVMRGEPSVRSVARALGRNLTQVHNDFMSLGVFTAPDAPVVRAFVYRVMEKYGCSPVFRRS
jgi:superfamily I DNA/RNA helicase